jgi:adenylate kinase family enzyme
MTRPGNAGGGKSTLARHLAELTGLPLYPLDLIQYKPGGGKVPHEDYLKAHADHLSLRDRDSLTIICRDGHETPVAKMIFPDDDIC